MCRRRWVGSCRLGRCWRWFFEVEDSSLVEGGLVDSSIYRQAVLSSARMGGSESEAREIASVVDEGQLSEGGCQWEGELRRCKLGRCKLD